MHGGLAFLEELEQGDMDWIFQEGHEQQVIANTLIIDEGTEPDCLYFVLEGLVGVTVASLKNTPLAKLGPGEIFGEMSFLKEQVASASVSALENSLLLALPRNLLKARLEEDVAFAGRVYRALALLTTGRLSRSVDDLGRLWSERNQDKDLVDDRWLAISKYLSSFKEQIVHADEQALKNGNQVPETEAQDLMASFAEMATLLNQAIGDAASAGDYAKREIGARVKREMLPYILMSTIGERMYAKPRGYAGDFLTIEHMYADKAQGTGRIGPVLDRAIRMQPANIAVMNRRGLLKQEIMKVIGRNEDGPARVTSLASGPAAELFDVFSELEDVTHLKANCIDIDLQALAFVGDKRDSLKLQKQMDLHNGNLVYLATGRKTLSLPPQDLVYSIGLIDYFSDKFVILLLNYVYDLLKPGGSVILGNFHPKNPSKALMDFLLDWKLIHRDEADMDRLFAASKFGKTCTRIRFEDQGVNLFAECVKAPVCEPAHISPHAQLASI